MNKRGSQQKMRRKRRPANNQTKLMRRFINVIVLVIIAVILLLFAWRLFFPKPLTPPVAPAPVATPAPAAKPAPASAQQPEFSFYDELKKRSDEVNAEVTQKLEAQSKQPEIQGKNYRIQIGAFKNQQLANQMRARMILRDYPVHIVQNGDIYLVQVGPYKDRDEAKKVQKRLTRDGMNTVFKAFIN